jgi:hypothetical protein
MNLQPLNTICFTLSIVCVVLGSVLAISMIWMDHDSEFLWKSWVTIGVIFLASVITLTVSKSFGARTHPAP